IHYLPGPPDDVLVQAAGRGATVPRDRCRPALGDVARVPRLRLSARGRKDDVEVARSSQKLDVPSLAPLARQMIVHGVGLTTELALATTRGRVIDRGDCLVVRTPDDPSYYDGNLLVFPAPLHAGELPAWTARFADELPDIRHRSFRW